MIPKNVQMPNPNPKYKPPGTAGGGRGGNTMSCHGCKYLDEAKKGPRGAGYCCQVVLSKFYATMECAMDCGHRAPKIRRPQDERCELYEPGDFSTRHRAKEEAP